MGQTLVSPDFLLCADPEATEPLGERQAALRHHLIHYRLTFSPRRDSTEKPSLDLTPENVLCIIDLIHSVANATRTPTARTFADAEFIEAVWYLSELIVWGEQNDAEFTLLFLERKTLDDCLTLLDEDAIPAVVKVQLLQTLSILFHNVRREHLIALLSSMRVKKLINAKLDLNDEEILSRYISLLKSLALTIDSETIIYFFDAQKMEFPIYTRCLQFFNNTDPMVRTSARCVILTLSCVDHPDVQAFLEDCSAHRHFHDIVSCILNMWTEMQIYLMQQLSPLELRSEVRELKDGSSMIDDSSDDSDGAGVRDLMDREMSVFEYISDALGRAPPRFTKTLKRHIFPGLISPLLRCLVAEQAPAYAHLVALAEVAPTQDSKFSSQEIPTTDGVPGGISPRPSFLSRPSGQGTSLTDVDTDRQSFLSSFSGQGTSSQDFGMDHHHDALSTLSENSVHTVDHEDLGISVSFEEPSPDADDRASCASGYVKLHRFQALRSLAIVVKQLGAHRYVVQPLARLLLSPRLPRPVVNSVLNSSGTVDAFEELMVRLQRLEHHRVSVDCIANPFHASLLALLARRESLERPFAVWLLQTIRSAEGLQQLPSTGRCHNCLQTLHAALPSFYRGVALSLTFEDLLNLQDPNGLRLITQALLERRLT